MVFSHQKKAGLGSQGVVPGKRMRALFLLGGGAAVGFSEGGFKKARTSSIITQSTGRGPLRAAGDFLEGGVGISE